MKSHQKIKYLYLSILILSLSLAFYSIYLYGIANHNIDLGQNLKQINIISGQTFVDLNSKNEIWSAEEMYINGNKQLNKSFFLLGISLFLFGFSLNGAIKFYKN